MATQLTPQPGQTGFANPIQQVTGFLGQPAIKRSLPLILMIGLVAAAALAWMTLRTPTQKVLFGGLSDADKSAVASTLDTANIDNAVDNSGNVTVAEEDYHKARMLLAGEGLPKAAPGGYALLDQLPMGVSRAVEGERLKQARETEIARSIEEIDAVAEARVHLATPESTVFVRDHAAPSASVVVKLQNGRALSDAQVRSIVNLVASSVPGMKPDAVTVVDQMGALLSKASDGPGAGNDARIAYQRQIEDKVRTQVAQLLTPLVGAANFTAEVQADVDLDETQATRETFDKQGALRAEQGNWTGNQPAGTAGAPGGIPGALSNTAPPPPTAQPPAPAPATAANGQPGTPATPAGPVTEGMKQSDSFNRAYDLDRQVSVSRTAPGNVRRLSVAVLLRDPDKGRRTALEIQQITGLVQAAVGFNAQRQDQVTVISKKFSGADAAASDGPAWYQAEWVPMVLRNVTAIVIALLVLFLGVRPLSKALLKKREDTPSAKLAFSPQPQIGAGVPADPNAPVSIDMLDNVRGYEDRVGVVRGFTRENPARAALAVRDMIRSEGNS